jgi:hypothetical protein
MSNQGPTGFITSQGLPNPKLPDGQAALARIGPRREVYVSTLIPDFKLAADEGSYLTGTNPTFGTGIAGPNTAAFSATSAIFSFLNKSKTGGSRTYLDYIRLICTAAGTGTVTSVQFGMVTDVIARGSAGTPVTLACSNQDASVGANTQVLYTPTVVAASNAVQNVARASGKTAANALSVGDEYLFVFGSVEKASGSLAYTTAVAGRLVIPMPPIILGPGSIQSALLHAWFVGLTAAASFEFDVGLLER